jgi:hypothetical protein
VDLIEFLTARLDEDEAAAKAVKDGSEPWPGQWQARDRHALETHNGWVIALAPGIRDSRDPRSVAAEEFAPGVVEHIARHDPARVLREAEADRTLLRELQAARKEVQGNDIGMAEPLTLRSRGYYAGLLRAAMIRATRFADHPDYRAEWKP